MILLKIKNTKERNRIKRILKRLRILYTENDQKKYNICIMSYNIEEIILEKQKKKKVIVLIYPWANKELDNILYSEGIYTFYKENELNEILIHLMRHKRKSKFIATIISFIIIIILIFLFIALKLNENSVKQNNKLLSEANEQKEENYKAQNIVFLGDSITDFYDLEKYYNNIPVVNSGTSGFQTKDIIKNLKNYVYIYNPTKLFLLIGTNDIAFTKITNDELIENINTIVTEIKKNRPKCEIYIESIYPVNKNDSNNEIVEVGMVGNRSNDRIKELNSQIKKLCKDNNITYINMYDKLINKNGNLKLKYTIDGLHMSDEGYKVITKTIMNYIKE